MNADRRHCRSYGDGEGHGCAEILLHAPAMIPKPIRGRGRFYAGLFSYGERAVGFRLRLRRGRLAAVRRVRTSSVEQLRTILKPTFYVPPACIFADDTDYEYTVTLSAAEYTIGCHRGRYGDSAG